MKYNGKQVQFGFRLIAGKLCEMLYPTAYC